MFRKINKIHFVGIGGIGMSGIAELLLNLGFSVSGSDIKNSEIIENLSLKGATIFLDHKESNIENCQVLVYSSAVSNENLEIKAAKNKKIPTIKRAKMLGELIALKSTSIAVSGTHGKTSTSSMIGSLLSYAKLDPTLVVGGLVRNLNSNSRLGKGDIIVVEADEYDKSFLQLKPTIAIITNIEKEHMDCYDNIDDLHNSFIRFANSVPFYGAVIACIDSPDVRKILQFIKRPIITYGLSSEADFSFGNTVQNKMETRFSLFKNKEICEEIKLNTAGKHNILNSLAAIAIGYEMGLEIDVIKNGINSYEGVRRRFEIKGEINNVIIVDDYAHHPSEVAATLEAANTGWNRRIIAVFQPHLFSRTKEFYKEFAKAFMSCDILIISDVYPAREKPIKGVSGKLIYNEAKSIGHKNIFYLPELDKLEPFLDSIIKENDMIITMGAGTIWRYGQSYYNHLKNNYNA